MSELNSPDLECLSCGAHWMQSCSCTPEQIKEAEDKHKRMFSQMVTMSWEELRRKLKIK